ncbi:Root meristem growth factor [Fagus crenata]
MAAVPCKRLILVVLIMLCLFSTTTKGARDLREPGKESQMNHDELFPVKEERVLESDELLAADYTPARRKPPIHN